MHAKGPRALSSSSVAARATLSAVSTRRCFQTSHRFRANTPENPPAADNGRQPGKPDGDQPSASRKQNNAVTESLVESPIRRVRGSVFSSGRQRPHRARVVDDFPPIKLPQSFLDTNISVFDPAERLRILAADPIWHRGYARLLSGNDLEAVSRRIGVLGETAQWLDQCLGDMWSPAFTRPSSESEFPKDLSIAFLEAKSTSDIVSIILSPERKVDIPRHKLLSKDKRKKVASDDDFLRARIDDHIQRISNQEEASAENEPPLVTEKLPSSLEEHGSRIYNNKLLGELASAVRAELHLRPDESWVRRELKRPLVVVNIPNYNGTYPSQRLLKRIAAQVDANVIRIDAQDLAVLVGGYLGQDSAYYKGSMSMLAYRTAEMNGRLAKGAEISTVSADDEMSGDIEAAWVNIRQHGSGSAYKSPLEEELQKIKEGARDYVLPSVDRWENLKINAALDHMVQAAIAKSSEAQQPLIIHVDNYVELTMTLEGALLLGRLRSIVDGLWRDGKRVALVGTSANEDPSEQYVSTLGEIAAEECLITFPLQHQRIPDWQAKKERREAMDFVQENLRNILAVSRSMNGDFESESEQFSTLLSSLNSAQRLSQTPDGIDIDLSAFPSSFTTSVLSGPDVYHIARLFHGLKLNKPSTKAALQIFLDVIGSHSANIVHASNKADEEKENFSSSRTTTQQKAEPERVQVGGHKYNEFEKKLLTGLVDVKEIRTTFADVHAPPATISALKLLTSLSLVRPEAFAYGVLANDRLPGCLLYGPPGTGKTLLAKAVAKESGASMLEVSGASINDMYVGQSEKNVRALFSLAKKLSPLVIFIDEADALFAARGQSRSRPSHRETINQFLREWDGMSDTKAFIMVATNRPFDLDDAVLRRLPRKILVDLPLQEDRESILRILLKGEQLDASVSIEDIARRTVLYSGSDLKNLTVAAAMTAVQEELEQAALYTGSEPYVYPERRTLLKRHFDKASGEIAASISEDMDSLKSIRKFDQKYGDQRSRNRKPRTMGFGIMPTPTDAEDARVRPAVPA
ncbi:spastin [Verticillium alfalfae VaMs.102]|uniref:Spastin n=1 Tax=Verticillium alfalfae (strain VaMs.102 / ATCC MYA-4576 / FGSC 10136) TaxID=526221 RepID=C9SE55_VERA1|nr:spastin [Verticillium alfalfae VaMs.102]EEY17302.1 spastin [Verticillium alfalfae VaMs.102]